MVRNIHDPQKAAARLVEEALQRGSNDNVSCVVLRFKLKGPVGTLGGLYGSVNAAGRPSK